MALVAALAAPARGEEIAFDAIFYRARAGFSFCYSFEGSAGWSFRPVGARIQHAGSEGCSAGATTPAQVAALADCVGGECHADCASFVRRAWAAGTNPLLRPVETPAGGNCANPSNHGGAHFLYADLDDDTLATTVAGTRPGDWCSNPDHVLMLAARRSDNGVSWTTWEANSSAEGIGTRSVTLTPAWFHAMPRNDCGFTSTAEAYHESGCWHPPAVRTPAPIPLLPLDEASLGADRLELELAFRLQRPDRFPALADDLLWLRWEDDDGAWQHRLVRLPAFTFRDDPTKRLVTFPGQQVPGPMPLDVSDVNTVEVGYAQLAEAPWAEPRDFKDPDSGAISATWTPESGLVPRAPETFTEVGLDLTEGQTARRVVTWQASVLRYGVTSEDGRTRRPAISVCQADAQGREVVAYCKDPLWSEPRTFEITPCVLPGCPRALLVPSDYAALYGEATVWEPPAITLHGAAELVATASLDGPVSAGTELRYDWTFSGDCDLEGPVELRVGDALVPLQQGGGIVHYTSTEAALTYRFAPYRPAESFIVEMYDTCTLAVSVKARVGDDWAEIPPVTLAATTLEIDARPLYEVPIWFIKDHAGDNAIGGAFCAFPDIAGVDRYFTFPDYSFDDQFDIIRNRGPDDWTWSSYLSRAAVMDYFDGWDPFSLEPGEAVWAFGNPMFTTYLHPLPLFNADFPYDAGDPEHAELIEASYSAARLRYGDEWRCVFEPYVAAP